MQSDNISNTKGIGQAVQHESPLKTGIRIVASGRALPEHSYTNDALKAYMDTDDEWIYTRTGIRERRYCDPDKESAAGLAASAAAKAIDSAKRGRPDFDVSEIGAVIAASCSASYMLPSIACMVQKELGLNRELLAFDLNAACSGFVYSITTARALMLSEGIRYCLIIGAEQLSKQLDLHDRGTGILFGDGAGAVIAELCQEADVTAFSAKAWANGNTEALSCGIYLPGTIAEGCSANTERSLTIAMNGHEVFRFAASAIPETIDGLLDKSGLGIDDIDYILCHQANARIIEHVKRRYRGSEEKFLMNIEHCGNTSSASIPILLDEMTEQGIIARGMRIMCVGFGAGLTWGGVIINT